MQVLEFHNELLNSCTYVVVFNRSLYLIDCGDITAIVDWIMKNEVEVKGIFLTHCHQDHIYGLSAFLSRYPQTEIYCSKDCLEGLKDETINLSYIIPECYFKLENEYNLNLIEAGLNTVNGGLVVDVIPTPGHSPDCLTYIIGDNIFTGDSYIPFAKVFTKWPLSQKEVALANEDYIKKMIEENNLKVYPGHWQ